ncbi:major facilitator superfamily domain-containing protein [Baffinella frigidus]|nr:major facilitator superfamily domain-containing protein [Cryptophyta sp. CCMP2293]
MTFISRLPTWRFDCHVNRRLVPAKIMLFWVYMANSFFFPFAFLILREAGLSALQIGTIAAIRPFVGIVSMPAWGFVADRFGAQKAVLLLNIICAAVTENQVLRVAFLLLSDVFGSAAVTENQVMRVAFLLLSASSNQRATYRRAVTENQIMLVVFLLLSDVFGSAVEPSMDATVLELLPDPGQYGRQRLWGAIGWGWVGAPLAGVVVATYGLSAAVEVHAALIALSLVIICPMTVMVPKRSGSPLAVAGIMFRDRVTFFFFLSILVIGQLTGAIFSFLFFLLQDLGDTGVVMGASLLLTCVTEVPVLAYADNVVRRILSLSLGLGLMNSMVLALV